MELYKFELPPDDLDTLQSNHRRLLSVGHWDDPFYSIYAFLPLLSVFGTIFMIAVFSYKTTLRTPHISRVFWMSIADLCLALRHWGEFFSYHATMDNDSLLCTLSGFTGIFFITATASWYFIISVFTCVTLRGETRWRDQHTSKQKLMEHLFVWGVSTVVAAYPLFAQEYAFNSDDGSCWLTSGGGSRLFLVILMGIYLIFSFLLLVQSLFITQAVLGLTSDGRRVIRRMVAFVGVFFGTWLWLFINDFYQVTGNADRRPTFLIYLDVIGVCGSGFFNFIVWSTSPAFRKVVCGEHDTLCEAIRAACGELKARIVYGTSVGTNGSVGSGPRAPLIANVRQTPNNPRVKFDTRGHLQTTGSRTDASSPGGKERGKQCELDPEADSDNSTTHLPDEEEHVTPKGRMGLPPFSDSSNRPIEEDQEDREETRNEDDEFL